MELRQYASVLLRWLWLIILGAVLAGGSAYLASKLMTPIYESAATLMINQGADASGMTYTDVLTSQNVAATYVEQIKSPVTLDSVIRDLDLPFDLRGLGRMLSVQQTRNTMLIQISVDDENPARAQAIANQIAKVFIQWNAANQQARYQAAQNDIDQQVADVRRMIDDTQKSLAPLGDPTDTKNVSEPEFVRSERLRLQMELNTLQAQYTVLLQSSQNFKLTASRSMDSITISSPARLPEFPVRPNTLMNTLLGLVVGLMLAVGVAFLIEYLDDTVKSSDDVTRALELSTLGTVARFPHEPDRSLITMDSPRAPYAEAYRNLRTNLQFSMLGSDSAALVVSSAEPGEGKTTTVANLGVVMAQMGKKVILVDADLRRPNLHQLFNLHPEPGITNVLLGEMRKLDEALVETSVPGLRVLTCGTIPPNPAELLASAWMEKLVDALKQRADVVLFDSPPILPVTDAALLSAKTGNLLLVIAAGKTRTDTLRRVHEALGRVNAKVLGAVINGMGTGRGYGYNYYYYYYTKDGKEKKKKSVERTQAAPKMGWDVTKHGPAGSPAELQPETIKE